MRIQKTLNLMVRGLSGKLGSKVDIVVPNAGLRRRNGGRAAAMPRIVAANCEPGDRRTSKKAGRAFYSAGRQGSKSTITRHFRAPNAVGMICRWRGMMKTYARFHSAGDDLPGTTLVMKRF